MLHPVDRFAVEGLLDGDVSHGGGRNGAVPVLLARGEPDNVAGADFFDRAAFSLRRPKPGDHDQRLAERMGVPRCPRAGLEGDGCASDAGRAGALNSGLTRNVPVNQSDGPLLDGREPLRMMSMAELLWLRARFRAGGRLREAE